MAEGGSDDLTPKDLTGDPGEGVESGVGGGEQQAEAVKHEPTPAKSAKKVTTDMIQTNFFCVPCLGHLSAYMSQLGMLHATVQHLVCYQV